MATATEPASKAKTRKKKTENIAVGFCLDETGSMGRCRQATIDGFNEFLADTKKQTGKTRLSLTKFSDVGPSKQTFRPVHEAVDIAQVDALTDYNPHGNTPLFDAIGYTVKKMESWVSAQKDDWAVMFVIQTDGEENASREYTREAIFDLIRRKEAEGWRFIYLGVDQDNYAAQAAATAMGMVQDSAFGYMRGQNVYATAAVADSLLAYRSSGGTADSAQLRNTAVTGTQSRANGPKATPQKPKKGSKSTPNF